MSLRSRLDPLLVFGAAVGLAHGAYVFVERFARPGVGGYVLVLSLIAIPLFAIRSAARRARGAREVRASWT
jgi:hypothetical protein